MTDHDFQTKVTDTLARLETKMDILVGPDGTTGWKDDVEQRLRRLENRRLRMTGMVGVSSAAITGALNWALSHFFGHH